MKKTNQIQEIRTQLKRGVPMTKGIELRARLSVYGETYKAQHSPRQVLSFIEENGNGLQIKRVAPDDRAVPYVWQLFTPRSAWVAGDSIPECFDRAMLVKKDWSKVSEKDVAELILAHQALKDARREDTVQMAEVAA